MNTRRRNSTIPFAATSTREALAVSVARVDRIFVASRAGAAPQAVELATLEPDRGIVGDRYHAGVGAFSRWPGEGRAVSLIEQETIDSILAETGLDLHAGQHRRNLVTCGLRLADLVGRKFAISQAILRGTRVCTECLRPDNLLGNDRPIIKKALAGRPGLRADVLRGGLIRVGDPIYIR